jgi:hypothetical protein
MSQVTQHSIPCILMQDHVDWMSICSDPIDSADKDGTFLNWIITGDDGDYFEGMWICVSVCE